MLRSLLRSAAWLLLAPFAVADLITVPGDFATIQAAIDAATDGDEIVVAPGTYEELLDLQGKQLFLHSSGGADVTIVDGAGVGPVVRIDSGEERETIVEGFTITGGMANQGGGLFISASSPTVRGCTIFDNASAAIGGGAYVETSSVLFEDCIVRENTAIDQGGGIFAEQADPELVDCMFEVNRAIDAGGGFYANGGAPIFTSCFFDTNETGDDGGGMTLDGTNARLSEVTFRRNRSGGGGGATVRGAGRPQLTDCVFERNRTYDSAGALFVIASEAEIVRCTFWANQTSERGGAVATFGEGSPLFDECVFQDNLVSGGGGAMYLDGGRALVQACDFSWNIAAGAGGAIRNFDTDAKFRDCTFRANFAETGGAVLVSGGRAPEFVDCDFTHNAATSGAGAILAANTFRIARSTFVGNRAGTDGGAVFIDGANTVIEDSIFDGNGTPARGGAIATSGGDPVLGGLTFHGNVASTGGALSVTGAGTVTVRTAILWGNEPDQIHDEGAGLLFVRHCDVEGGWPGLANIDADPLWVDPTGGDFRLMEGSPCIDAGSTEDYGETLTADPPILLAEPGGTITFTVRAGKSRLDLDGNERFVAGTQPPSDPPKPDLGAFEWGSAPAKSFIYLLAGTASGTDPGFELEGLSIPLVPDSYFELTLNPEAEVFVAFRGQIVGQAQAQLQSPPGLGALAGLLLHHAFITVDAGGLLDGVSSAEPTFVQ